MGDDVAGKADGDVWTNPPSQQDSPLLLWTAVRGTVVRQGGEQFRLPRVHAVLEAVSRGSLDPGIQDPSCAPHAGHSGSVRPVPTPSASAGEGAARNACEAGAWPHELFGVNGNIRSLHLLVVQVQRAWFKWLRRRSQRTRLTWERYQDLLRDFPLPRPRIVVQIWGR